MTAKKYYACTKEGHPPEESYRRMVELVMGIFE